MDDTTCTVKMCIEDRMNRDTLFCPEHRLKWRILCRDVFGYEEQANTDEIEELLIQFQNNMIIVE